LTLNIDKKGHLGDSCKQYYLTEIGKSEREKLKSEKGRERGRRDKKIDRQTDIQAGSQIYK
jgi:hypothetical protein